MVNTYFPTGDLCAVVTARVDVEVPPEASVTGLGLNVAVAFAGKPVTERLTLPAKVLRDFKVMVKLALPPTLIVWTEFPPEIVKSGAVTASATDVVWVRVPSVPVMVML
jgi:hypothetical protein